MASSELSRIKERAKSRKSFNEIYDHAINAYLIHYSCESFYAPVGQPPTGASTRVTSIAVRNLKSAQTKSWSIQKSAELSGQLNAISQNLNALELDMLNGYFSWLSKNIDCKFIHWNMRDDNYGFSALEHRHRVLGGNPPVLNDNCKLDLARELVTIYGLRYAPHISPKGRRGRLMSVIEMNSISDTDALQGADEAAAFVNGNYLMLHQSTLRKVDILAGIFDRVHDRDLKTHATFTDKYGVHPVALIELMKDNLLVSAFIFLSTIGAAMLKYKQIFSAIKSMFP